MSTRTHFVSLTSIDPIRDAVASHDKALVEVLVARYTDMLREDDGDEEDIEEELEEFRERVEEMILCRTPPKKEPGCWNYVIELMAEHFKLKPNGNLPFNEGWKHYHVWEQYRGFVADHLTQQSAQSLAHLEDGRPLRGARIDHDGCCFGWLSLDEVTELHGSLSRLDRAVITDEELLEFHDVLVQSLKTIARRKAVLFMAAH